MLRIYKHTRIVLVKGRMTMSLGTKSQKADNYNHVDVDLAFSIMKYQRNASKCNYSERLSHHHHYSVFLLSSLALSYTMAYTSSHV